jgi:hypothetical protein
MAAIILPGLAFGAAAGLGFVAAGSAALVVAHRVLKKVLG